MQDNNLIDVNLTSEMKTSFIDYAMSVIVSRALPDVRDRVYNREPFRVGAEGDGVAAQQRDDLVHKAVLFNKGDHHARGHYHGDEIGHIAGCLHQLFVA